MLGMTPPSEIITWLRSLLSSSSFLRYDAFADQRRCDVAESTDEPDGELEMPRVDAAFLVVTRSISGELEDLGRKVFEDSREVY
jgi:hypothetical protein